VPAPQHAARSPPDAATPDLELRLHQQHVVGGPTAVADGRQTRVREMNETSATTRSGSRITRRLGELGRCQRPGVHPLDHAHAVVAADESARAAVADIEGDHLTGAALEENLSESARRGADVEREPARSP
jgi:hypothetical protein